jgi:hypothetical protein
MPNDQFLCDCTRETALASPFLPLHPWSGYAPRVEFSLREAFNHGEQLGQQLPVPGVPPCNVHLSCPGVGVVFGANARTTWQRVPLRQSVSAVHELSPDANVPSVHVPKVGLPAVVSQVPNSWNVHVSNAGLPKVERAAQRITLPRQRVEMPLALTCRDTQLTYWPWFRAPPHCVLMASNT